VKLPTRPRIRLRLPREIRAGGTFRAEVVLDAKRAVKVERVRVELDGHEAHHRWLGLRATLVENETLPEGRTSLSCRFELPERAPPTYAGRYASVRYTMKVSVVIPWWADREQAFVVHVLPPDVPILDEDPYVFSTAPRGPKATELYLEGSLDGRTLRAGGSLSGNVALANLAYHRVHAFELALTARESGPALPAGPEAHRYVLQLRVPAVDGEAVSFRMGIPAQVAPSFQSRWLALRWSLEIRARVRFGDDLIVRIPVTVLPPGETAAARRPRFAPPTVGSARVRALWADVAKTYGLELEGGAMIGRRGDVQLAIGRQHRGREGVFLVASLEHPSVHLGLDGGLLEGFRRLLGGNVPIHPKFDEDCYATGRDPRQVTHYVRACFETVFPTVIRVADLHDEGAVLQWRDSGQSRRALEAFVKAAIEVAERTTSARDVPPPKEFDAVRSAWEEVAAELEEGALETARMCVTGKLDGRDVRIATIWEDRHPARTRVSLAPASPIDESFHVFPGGAFGELPKEAQPIAESLAKDGQLEIGAERIALVRTPAVLDPSNATTLLRRMSRLAAALRAHAGPYR